MTTGDQVRALLKKHFWEMKDDNSLSTGPELVLPEDAIDFFEEYFSTLNINSQEFKFNDYFPNKGIWFLPNAILPEYLKTEHHKPRPLTVKMLIKAAEDGRWTNQHESQ